MLGIGKIVEGVCDALGLPEELGDLAAIGADAYTGNWLGAAMNVQDFVEPSPAPGDPELE